MFCPKCGRKAAGLCFECFLEDNPVHVKQPKLYVCDCGSIQYHSLWRKMLEEETKDLVKKHVRVPYGLCVDEMTVEPEFEVDKIRVKFVLAGTYGGERFSKSFEDSIPVVRKVCPTCSRLRGDYYEAVIQLRCKPAPELDLDGDFITKTMRVRGGVDVYISSKNYAKKISSELKKKGYAIKQSFKHAGSKDGREVTRMYVSVKNGAN